MKHLLKISALVLCAALWMAAQDRAWALHTMDYEGTLVESIAIKGLKTIGPEEFLDLIGLRPWSVLEPEMISRGLKRAFMKGIFRSITIRYDETPEHIVVRVVEKDRVSSVRVSGNRRVSANFVRDSLMFKKYSYIRYDQLEEAEKELRNQLDKKGYPLARVNIGILHTGIPYRVGLSIEVDEGTPLRIKEVLVTGDNRAAVLDIVGVGKGNIYDRIRLEQKLLKLKLSYLRQGYRNPSTGSYAFYDDGTLVLHVFPGVKFSVEFRGNDRLSTGTLRDAVSFQGAESLRPDLIEDAVLDIKRVYAENGYPSATAAPVVIENGDGQSVVFYIYEGSRVTVGSIGFSGSAVQSQKLRAIVRHKINEAFNPAFVATDKKNLESFFRALGHTEVRVLSDVVLKGDEASLNYHIERGPRKTIGSIGVEGNEDFSQQDVIKALGVSTGDPYNEVDLLNGLYGVFELCYGAGFPECSADLERTDRGETVDITVKLRMGRKLLFGKTIVRGNLKTRRDVFQRELAWQEGQPLDRKLLPKTRRRLYALGLFSSVDIKTLEPGPGGVSDILVEVVESSAGSVEFALGYGEYEKSRGSVTLSYVNLFGLNRRGSVTYERNTLEKRFVLNYEEPWFFNRDMRLRLFFTNEDREERNLDTGLTSYKLRRSAASVGVEKQLTPRIKTALYYEYSITDTYEVRRDVVLSREDVGTLSISGIRPEVYYDTRNSEVDPASGLYAGISLKYASKLLFSESRFFKAVASASYFVPAGKRVVLAFNAEAGGSTTFDGTEELPIVERFFLGGRNTVRGYNQDTIGPSGYLGTPVGGGAYYLFNVEARIYTGGGLGGVLFMDAGTVAAGLKELDYSDLVYTVGAGVRYNTPVGPLRLDYGYKLNRLSGESAGELHFSLGHAF